jgi:hypothetical protein
MFLKSKGNFGDGFRGPLDFKLLGRLSRWVGLPMSFAGQWRTQPATGPCLCAAGLRVNPDVFRLGDNGRN